MKRPYAQHFPNSYRINNGQNTAALSIDDKFIEPIHIGKIVSETYFKLERVTDTILYQTGNLLVQSYNTILAIPEVLEGLNIMYKGKAKKKAARAKEIADKRTKKEARMNNPGGNSRYAKKVKSRGSTLYIYRR